MPSDTEPPAAHEMSMQPESAMTSMAGMEGMRMPAKHSGWRSVVRSTLHCGAGCTLADLIGEGFLYFVPIAVGGSFVLGSWVFDYLLALVLGIYFQFSAIRSMRQTPKSKAFEQAVKADFLSLTAWQVGMYGAHDRSVARHDGGTHDMEFLVQYADRYAVRFHLLLSGQYPADPLRNQECNGVTTTTPGRPPGAAPLNKIQK